MDADLEALIKAYNAFIQARGIEASELLSVYDAKLEEVLIRHPNLSQAALRQAVPFCSLPLEAGTNEAAHNASLGIRGCRTKIFMSSVGRRCCAAQNIQGRAAALPYREKVEVFLYAPSIRWRRQIVFPRAWFCDSSRACTWNITG